jgi:hypothetical protein
MRSISIRNIPDPVYDSLKNIASNSRRSLQEQVVHILERETRLTSGTFMANALELRKILDGRNLKNAADEVRQDRKR